MNIRRISTFLLTGVLLIGMLTALTGCGDNNAGEKTGERTVVDQRGKTVVVPEADQIKKIVTLPIPMPSIIYAVDGSGERIVGMHPKSQTAAADSMLAELAPELLEDSTAFVQEGFTVNIEELLKLDPDVVFQWNHQPDEIKKMEEAGLTVIGIDYGSQENLEGWIKLVGDLLGKEDRAEELVTAQHKTLDYINTKLADLPEEQRIRVFYLAGENLTTCGKGTYNQFWMESTGAKNVAQETSGWGKAVNMEQILAWNPEIIYIGNFCDLQPKDILENKIAGQDWSQVEAVKKGQVYKIPLAGYRWDPPCVESPMMFKWLAQIQHPDIFNEYSMKDELKAFYAEIYDYELSDEKAVEILNLKQE
ncbi:MAG: ABC transporter substrate-binding protein [Bacillota bacterium]|nr:ABC transporter substrate-binding protein [Bacillota bacterium]